MVVLFPYVFIPFCFQFIALNCVKNRFLRWSPLIIMEALLLIGMMNHQLNPPSFDILGWQIWLWVIGSVFLGGMLAWGAYALYERKSR